MVKYTGGSIPPGAILTFTFNATLTSGVAPDDVLVNTATVSQATTLPGTATGERNEPPVSSSASLEVVAPAIHIVKSASRTTLYTGEGTTYSYTVTNPGDVPLAALQVDDDKCSAVQYVGGDGNGNGRLEPGESWTYRCTMAVGADTTNTATTTGQPSDAAGAALPGIGRVKDDAIASVNVIKPAIHVTKCASAPVVRTGDVVTYTYEVTNPGDDPLAGVTVSDDRCAPVTRLSAVGNGLLDPSDVWLFQCATTLTTGTTNTATAAGADSLGGSVKDVDRATVQVIRPGIRVVKSGPATSSPGATAIYTFTVSNTGDVPLTNVSVSDTLCQPVVYVSGDANSDTRLDLNETWTYTCSYLVKPSDPHPLTATATTYGTDPLGRMVSAQDGWRTDLVQLGAIGNTMWLDEIGNGIQDAGEPGLPEVAVRLLDSSGNPVLDANGNPITTVTDANGK